eukprot:SAG22_NODE_19052_length_278_cov_1.156425_1_plen_62_part_10
MPQENTWQRKTRPLPADEATKARMGGPMGGPPWGGRIFEKPIRDSGSADATTEIAVRAYPVK